MIQHFDILSARNQQNETQRLERETETQNDLPTALLLCLLSMLGFQLNSATEPNLLSHKPNLTN